MILYVAVGGWSYEGYDDPIGVFSTRKRAEAAVRANKTRYNFVTVFKVKLNEPGFEERYDPR